jgi:hypothetical protein
VLVTHVLPESPASGKLRRHDLLLEYGKQPVRDCESLARLIQNDAPERTVRLLLLRGGKETTAEVTLARGPALRIAPAQRGAYRDEAVPKAVAKPSGPSPVSVAAVPLENGRLRVTVEYCADSSGRLRTITCEGVPSEIDSEVGKLPERERNLTRAALLRIQKLNAPKSAP